MSKDYKQLISCEKKLRNTLITKTVINHPTTETSQYRLRSYRVLCHAEIEHYVENRVFQKIASDKLKWQKKSIISNSLSSLLAYTKTELPHISTKLVDVSPKNDITFRINKVISIFEKSIINNHGIKEQNIIPLLISIGIDYTQLDQTMLNNMSSFGGNRGFTAHHSSKVQHYITPADEISMVQQIIQDLNLVDNLIDQI